MGKVKWVNLIPVPVDKYKWGMHAVYLVYAPHNGIYKIGWSERIDVRLNALQRDPEQLRIATPPYRLVHTIDTGRGRYLERQLHLLFAHRHVAGEWYRLTRHDVDWIIALGDNLEYGIPLHVDIVPPLADDGPSWDE